MNSDNMAYDYECSYCKSSVAAGDLHTFKHTLSSDVYNIMTESKCCNRCAFTLKAYEDNKDNPLLFVINGSLYLYDKENVPPKSDKGLYLYVKRRKDGAIIKIPRCYHFEDFYDAGFYPAFVKKGKVHAGMGIHDNASWSDGKEFDRPGSKRMSVGQDGELVDLQQYFKFM